MTDKIDFVTVVFGPELGLLQLQARSISRFADPDMLGVIWIVIEDERSDQINSLIRDEILPAYDHVQKFSDRVRIIEGRKHWPVPKGVQGWSFQQVAKLRIAESITAPFYVALDAKNHFIRTVGRSTFLADDGRARTHLSRKYGRNHRWAIGSYAAFDVAPENVPELSMPTITPFVMETELVRAMVKALESKHGDTLANLLVTHGDKWTEFFLYQAYLFSAFGSYEAKCAPEPKTYATLFTNWPTEPEQIEAELEFAYRPNVYTFGLHRTRIAGLSEDHRARILNLWLARGLISANEDLSWIMPGSEPVIGAPEPLGVGVRERLGMKLLLDPASIVDQYVIKKGYWESRQIKALNACIQRLKGMEGGAIFLDVGAFWGLYSLLMRKHRFFGEIVAYESDHRNFAQLQAQLFLNNVIVPDEIRVVFSAVTDESKPMRMLRSEGRLDGNRGAAGVMRADTGKPSAVVPGTALDDIHPQTDGLVMAKIDVEGHEAAVIAGAERLFTRNKTFLQIECWKGRAVLDAQMQDLGFSFLGAIGPDCYFTNIAGLGLASDLFERVTLEPAT